MELRQLRYFLTLAAQPELALAARKLSVSQSVLLQQITLTEEKLGLQLFQREQQQMLMTEAGAAFNVKLRPIVADLDQCLMSIRAEAPQRNQHLSVSVDAFVGLLAVNRTFMRFTQAFPQIELEQAHLAADQIEQAVLDHQVDAGFTPNPVNHPSLQAKIIQSGHWGVVVSSDHAFASQLDLSIHSLHQMSLIMFSRNLNLRLHRQLTDEFERHGVEPKKLPGATQVRDAYQQVKAQGAVYLTASFMIDELPSDLRFVPISGFGQKPVLSLIWHHDNPRPALQNFIGILEQEVAL